MIEKPKKERKFLKVLGKVGEILIQELLIKVGRSLVKRIGGKKTLPSIIFLSLFVNIAFASIDSIPYPITGNKQRLGWQTTGNGLVWRGLASDTITKPTNYVDKNVKAYLILDSVTGSLYVFKQGVWSSVSGGSSAFTQPVDSLFFKTSVATNNVDTAKMRWDSDLGTVVLGMYDKVPNELGFKNFWLVKNQTGSTITKGSIVYANGTVGASGRLTIAKFIANGTIEAKYLLGIAAHDLSNGEDGYVISYGKIRQVNTDTFAAGALLYPSPTVAGAWTDIEPKAPNINMPIGFCINSSSNNGTIAIRVASGYKMHELHDVDTTGLSTGEGLIYNGSYFVSSNGKLLTPSDTTSLSNRINLKLNIADTSSMLTNYLRTGVAASTYLPLTGGTLTGGLTGTTGTFNTRLGVGSYAGSPLLFASGTGNQEVHFAHSQNIAGATVTLRLTNTNSGFFDQGMYMQGIVERGINEMSGAIGTNGSEYIRLRGIDDGGIVGVGIFNTNPSYNLDLTGTFRATGNSLIGGTLGVTGATTMTGALTVNNSAVFNEGSTDSDFRVESDGNANMVFVDASTDRVGIGTNTPSKTLDVNGEVKIGTTTATPTSLLGKDANNVVGNVRVISPLALAGDSINLNTVPISKGGTGSTSESGARSNLGVGYVFYASTAGDAISLSSNRVFIVNSGGSSTTTITLGTATAGRTYMIKNLSSGTIISDSNNVIPLNGGSAGTVILVAGNTTAQWCTLVCDGTNWVIMQAN